MSTCIDGADEDGRLSGCEARRALWYAAFIVLGGASYAMPRRW